MAKTPTTTVSTTTHAAQSVMARILATENIRVVVDPKMTTAAFDLKNRTLLLPQWKDMGKSVYDMLIGHEISHALHTPAEGWRETCNKISGTTDTNSKSWQTASLYLNVVEDARIERLIQIKFPGFRRDFIAAYNELNDKNFFGVKGVNMNTLTLADRINLYYKLGTIGSVGINFTPAEDQFIRRIDNATTFADAAQIAEDLFKFCMEQQHKNQPQQNNGNPNKPCNGGQSDKGQNKSKSQNKSNESQEQGSESDSDNTQDGSRGDQGGDKKRPGSGDAQDGGDEQQDQGKQPADQSQSNNDKGEADGVGNQSAQTETAPPTPTTQQTFNDKISQQVHRDQWSKQVNAPTELVHCDISKVVIDCKKIVEAARTDAAWLFAPAKEDEVRKVALFTNAQDKFMRDSKKQIDLLVKQFELRKAAQIAKRESVRKTGILDTVRMVNYKHSEDIFRRNTMLPEGKNHGLVMFVDWSGSMQGTIDAVMEQTMVLVEFCRRMQIPYEVFAFTTRNFSTGAEGDRAWTDEMHAAAAAKRKAIWQGEVGCNYDSQDRDTTISRGVERPRTHSEFSLLNLFSSRLSRTEHKDMMLFMRAFVSRGRLATDYISDMFNVASRWELSGTALDETIVAAMQIVPQFKSNNKLDIVNTIFLTDGETSVPYCGGSLIDPKTKATYSDEQFRVDGNRYSTSSQYSTDVLLLALRDITKANVVGMFLTTDGSLYPDRHFRKEFDRRMKIAEASVQGDKFRAAQAQRNARQELVKELRAKFNEDNCLIADGTSTGYSEFYLIKSSARVVDKNDPMDSISVGASQLALKKAFLKSFEGKNKSRVLINRFIELIAR